MTSHELVMEGVDALGTMATKLVAPVPLKKGDVVQIVIGEIQEAEPGATTNAG